MKKEPKQRVKATAKKAQSPDKRDATNQNHKRAFEQLLDDAIGLPIKPKK